LYELRKDVLTDQWVAISTSRGNRPTEQNPQEISHFSNRKHDPRCPFCPGNEKETPPEIMAAREKGSPNDSGWRIRVVPNKYPAVMEKAPKIIQRAFPFKGMAGEGRHEVVIETREHNLPFGNYSDEHVTELFLAERSRFRSLYSDPKTESVIYFKNSGSKAGISLHHPHSQIISLPVAPPALKNRMNLLDRHWEKKGRCLVCDYIKKEIEAGVRIIQKDNDLLICHPYGSKTPFETWIMPLTHTSGFGSFADALCTRLALALRDAISTLEQIISPFSYNINFIDGLKNQPDNRFHFFARIFPRFNHIAGFELGTGMFINTHSPEKTTEIVRENMKQYVEKARDGLFRH